MPAERYFLPEPFAQGQVIEIKDKEFHHLAKVMRSREGDRVELVNGRGQLAKAHVKALGKRSADLRIEELIEEAPAAYEQILMQAIPRLNRLDTIVEKATELGVTEIWLFPGAHSEKKELSANQRERIEGISIAAMKQCGRLHQPKILFKDPLKKCDELPENSFFGDLDPEAPLFEGAWKAQAQSGGCLFVVGPEAGLNDQEEEKLRQLGATGVKLHANILRTDTAPIVAFSLINHWLLD